MAADAADNLEIHDSVPESRQFSRNRRDYLVQHQHELRCGIGYDTKRNLPYCEARPLCRAGDLCQSCEYALHLMLWPLTDEERDVADNTFSNCLGWIDRLTATTSCAFCQFVVKIFHYQQPDFPENEVACETCRRRFQVWLSHLRPQNSTDIECPKRKELSWSCSLTFQECKDETSDCDRKQSHCPYDHLLTRSSYFSLDASSLKQARALFSDLGQDSLFFGMARIIPEFWNVRLFKDALEACRSRHGARCNRTVRVLRRQDQGSDVPISKAVALRVVDVQSMRIAMLPDGAQYVALSYCWAAQAYTTLVRANHPSLERVGSLAAVELAPTISDSIEVVKSLGERYIWIDCLCIVQDDVADKRLQLGHMDDVYRAATVTIVAAGSKPDGMDVGLPGVTPSPKRTNLNHVAVRGMGFRQSHPSIFDHLKSTRWHSRAWTFQEYLLSKRLLIFAPEQVYYSCEQANFAEEIIDHVCGTTDHVYELSLTPCCDLTISKNQADGFALDGPNNYHNTYEDLVRSYTKRQMTYESDALNAARGMLSLLRRESGIEFLCGLPMEHLLGRYLMWCPNGTSARRKPTRDGTVFPSWSWSGWKGGVFYPDNTWPDTAVDEGFKPGGISCYIDSEVEDWTISSHALEQETNSLDLLATDVSSMDSCELRFSAETARFEVTATTYGNVGYRPEIGEESPCRHILAMGVQAGALVAHCEQGEYAQYLDENEKRTYEFVALSRAEPRWKMWYPIVESDLSDDLNDWYYIEEMQVENHPFDGSVLDVLGSIVNVLLIYRDNDGTAYRAGVGQIHADAWDAANPEVKNILLG